jgi:hypothetical protein
MNGYCTLWKDFQRRQQKFSSSLPTYSLDERLPYAVEGFADLQRQQLRFSSSLCTYSLDERLPYTVEGFTKTIASVFSSLPIYILWMRGNRTQWKDLQRRQLKFSSSLFFELAVTVHRKS